MNQIFSLLHAQSAETGSRTDVLKPLVYAMGILFTAIIAMLWRSAPIWMLGVTAVLLVIVTLAYLGSYTYCLVTNPDLLRSETYGLKKMAIERGALGDSDSGINSRAIPTQHQITVAPPTTQTGDQQ